MKRDFSAFTVTLDYREDHGIKGQRWGIRRFQNEDGSLTPSGRKRYSEVLSSKSNKTGETVFINRHRGRNAFDAEHPEFDIVVGDKKVGNLYLDRKGSGELNVNWINVGKKHQGKGYANTVINQVVAEAKKRGYKKVTLEVPDGDEPAMRVYEKNGFVAKYEDDIGLIHMELKL